jgi:hypothetical protein
MLVTLIPICQLAYHASVFDVHMWCAVVGKLKLALEAGKANPAPPVGPALGARVSYT